MKVDDIMTQEVVTIRATQTIADAIQVFADRGVRHLPVLGDAGQLIGILSDRDVRSLGLTRAIDVEAMRGIEAKMAWPVSRVMSSDVATVGPQAEVTEVIDCMLENDVGAVPVVDDAADTLVGIVSYVDILRAIRREPPA